MLGRLHNLMGKRETSGVHEVGERCMVVGKMVSSMKIQVERTVLMD